MGNARPGLKVLAQTSRVNYWCSFYWYKPKLFKGGLSIFMQLDAALVELGSQTSGSNQYF